MKIFKNNRKVNTYKISCHLDKAQKVRDIAEQHSVKGSIVEVRAHDSLLKDNVRVTVKFKSKDSKHVIYREVLEEFRKHDISIVRNNISIHRETGLI